MYYLLLIFSICRPLLKNVNTTEGNIILDCKTENIIPILEQAKSLKMLDLTDSYLLTSLVSITKVTKRLINRIILVFFEKCALNFLKLLNKE